MPPFRHDSSSIPMRSAPVAAFLLALPLLVHPARAADPASGVEVSIARPRLTGGTVSGLDEALEKTRDGVAACVAAHGGLTSDAGRIEVQFLVRERGRAEAVEVTRFQNVSSDVAACVQKLLRNRPIGDPSEDPVGVMFGYRLKRRS